MARRVRHVVLQDHFRPPLGARRHWHAFHNAWATYLSSDLNRQLPEGYFAEPNVQFGIEIDVAVYEEADFPMNPALSGTGPDGWIVPAPTQTIPLPLITDVVEVLVFDREERPTLAGAIELVSPANKDRPDHRDAFVTKCAAYLQQGLGLAIVDVVTGRRFPWHEALLKRRARRRTISLDADLYATSYRPVDRDGQPSLDIWRRAWRSGSRCRACRSGCEARFVCTSTWTRPTTAPAASNGSPSGRTQIAVAADRSSRACWAAPITPPSCGSRRGRGRAGREPAAVRAIGYAAGRGASIAGRDDSAWPAST